MGRYLITGGAGFIGSHTAERLLSRGDEVVVLDDYDPYYDPAVKRRTAALLQGAGAEVVEGDVRDREAVATVLKGIDKVVHLAARPGVRASVEDPHTTFSVNVMGTVTLLEEMRLANVGGLVLASSSSVYGGDATPPFREEMPASRPLSPYAASKRACEHVSASYSELYGLGVFALRFFSVYGPRGRPDMSIGKFTRSALLGEPVPMYGDGSAIRDFTYVTDIVDGIVAALDRVDSGTGFLLSNIGGGVTTTMKELLTLIEGATRCPLSVEWGPPVQGDMPCTHADLTRARELLGFESKVSLAEGLAHTAAWMRQALGRAPHRVSGPVDLGEARVRLRGVAFLACGYDAPGGMEGQARSLAGSLAGLGVPVTYVTTLPSGVQAPLRETRGLVTIYRLPVPRAVDWATTLELLEVFCLGVVRARRARLNLIYSVHHETGAIACRVGQALELPVVVKLACSGVFGDANLALRHPDGPRILRALAGATRVVAITDDIAREARRELQINGERLVRLPNGVDLARFRPRPDGRVADPRVVFVGRLSAQKRVDVLLEAFARLARSERWPELELVLVGDGPIRPALEAQARDLRIAGRVHFRGIVSDPLPELRKARVFVLPSIAEGASNALLEALATGVPCVATNLPGTAELVRDGEHALLVPPADAEALSVALTRVLSDSDLAQRLSGAGRQRAAEFGIESVARRHLDLFHALAAPVDVDPTRPTPGPAEGPLLRAFGSAGIRGVGGALRSLAGVLSARLSGPRP